MSKQVFIPNILDKEFKDEIFNVDNYEIKKEPMVIKAVIKTKDKKEKDPVSKEEQDKKEKLKLLKLPFKVKLFNMQNEMIELQTKKDKSVSTGKGFSFKYMPLNTILSNLHPIKKRYGLFFDFDETFEDVEVLVLTISDVYSNETKIYHKKIVSSATQRDACQGRGSGLTYSKRYILEDALFLVGDIKLDPNENMGEKKPSVKYTKLPEAKPVLKATKLFVEKPIPKDIDNMFVDINAKRGIKIAKPVIQLPKIKTKDITEEAEEAEDILGGIII